MLNSLLLFGGLILTDFIFQTQLHAMMLRLSGNSGLLYAAIMLLESAIISGLHLLFIFYAKRRLLKIAGRSTD